MSPSIASTSGEFGSFSRIAFAYLHRERVGADVEICLRQLPRDAARLLWPADLVVRVLQDLERLIVVGLCLSNDLKHLDRLNDLRMLLLR
jgi:hypothetical protein